VTATEVATFELVDRAIVKSEGKLMAGPAMSIATAAPAGAPAESSSSANGISKNVGIASGAATRATAMMTRICAPPEEKSFQGTQRAIAIETTTPIAINGTVRIATCRHDRTNAMNIDRVAGSVFVEQFMALALKSCSTTVPVKKTIKAAIMTRIIATQRSNNIKVRMSVAGLKFG
jgi:hypothetical protein